MDKLIFKLKNRASYKQPYRGITITDAEADEIIEVLEQEQKLLEENKRLKNEISDMLSGMER